jgi:cytochrome c5
MASYGTRRFRYNVRLYNAPPQEIVMSESHEAPSSPIKTPKQLIIVITLAFVVPIAVIVMLSQLITTGLNTSKEEVAASEAAINARLKPIGQVEVTDPNAPKVEKTGKEVVDTVCAACHASGALGAPKIGDKASWAPHLGGGLEHLVQNAVKGVKQMPPRGGNPDLSDTEIARAIVYMANQSGANFKEPAAKQPAAPTGATAAKGPAK